MSLSIAKFKKYALPAAILIGGIVISQLIISNPPQANRQKASKAPQMTVEVQTLTPQLYQVKLSSFGTIRPRTESVLVAQASGQINYISDSFRDGGFFEQGDVLLKLDDRDHQADVKIAQANLLDIKQQLAEEQARADQALTDWKRLGKQGQPNALVLREPQLAAAKAKLLSAQAQLDKAKLTLERTTIVAPYAGRILNKNVDLGQVISMNSQLANIYAVDYVEVRLPLKNQDLELIDLPEEYRNQQVDSESALVVFESELSRQHKWQGSLVRTEGAIDSDSQQLYVVAQIEDPYALTKANDFPIKIGQYVSAKVTGKLLSDVLVIPNKAIYQGSYVYIVEEGVLKRREVTLLWKNETDAIIKSGLNENEQLVVTSLGQVSSGTRVSIAGAESKGDNTKEKANSKPNKARSLSDLPKDRQEKIKQMAEKEGISPEKMFENMQAKRKQRTANGD
ncbi:efflux RND transporter periplasmic adaptor subunit [Psychrosphaera sp. F3M07]|uniref:efflux RND transporter periplasmic adaptor subunit n=1 Tax=Psychrosphaera sp. F3M07 TaxID=2841560 RepID=UPI001C07F602|nr:efflux RND transporter periplasmic adaptor subunit [Psychrosphaera sp. F3M07]MBU2916841.1 efflux RND transporter periplasmic adaptor subunit [Psychrosphaera sp. F3M07]